MADTFKQKRWGVRTGFAFGIDALDYTISDGDTERSARVRWDQINLSQPTALASTARRPLLWLTIGFALSWAAGFATSFIAPVIGTILVLGGVVMFFALLIARLSSVFKVRVTVFPANPGGSVRVIQDKHHDTICDALTGARRNWFRHAMAEVNLLNDPHQESAKFGWLLQNEFISETEHAEAISRIRSAHPGGLPPLASLN